MIYKLMRCCSKNGEWLALIDINAISEMTWHEDGIHIYWRKYVQKHDKIITVERAGCIVCDWTEVEEMPTSIINSLKRLNVEFIFKDTTIYNSSLEVSQQYKIIRSNEN